MSAKRKGLGRGLDALLGASAKKTTTASAAESSASSVDQQPIAEASAGETLKKLPVEFLSRGKYQPRRDIQPEALEELAESIKAQGIMQPIVVRPLGQDRYEIIAGERRWRATQLAGLDTIPAIIRDVSDEAAIAMALIENIQREDLNPIEEAIALKRLQDEFELTQLEVAEAVGKSRSAVTNLLRLMSLDEEVKKLLEHGDIEMGHARSLLSLSVSDQRDLARQVIAKALSVRQTEALVRRFQQQDSQSTNSTSDTQSPDISQLEDGLSDKIGVPVKLTHNAKGRGKLVLSYNSLDELDGILAHLQYSQD